MFSLIYKKIARFFKSFGASQGTVGQKVARGGILLFAQKPIVKGLQFLRTVIIARLLFPDDIGLFALASLSLTLVSAFIQFGLNSAIIHGDDKEVRHYLDNAWTVSVLRGLCLGALLFASAPLLGNFFENSAAVPLIRLLALLPILEGFESIGVVLLQKQIRAFRQFIYDVGGIVAQIAVIIILAYLWRSPWALAWGAVAGRTSFLILSYLTHSYRPRFDFNFHGSRELFKYGKWIALSGILTFLVARGDSLIIGKALAPSTLAFYQMAFSLGTLPAIELARSLNAILFPLYSKFKNEPERLERAFLRVFGVVMALIVPATVGIAILAPELVSVVYGSRWLEMVPILYVVLILGLLKSFEYLTTPLLLGTGQPKTINLALVIQGGVFFALAFYLTGKFGAVGTALAALMSVLITQIFYLYTLIKVTRIKLFSLLARTILPLISSGVMFFFLYLIQPYLNLARPVELILIILAGALVYSLSVFLLDFLFGKKIRESYLWIKENI